MGKIAGSYDSVVRGVSEQVAQDRRPGQHTEQINFVSDPVRGLARRWGSQYMAADAIQAIGNPSALYAETARMREFSYVIDSVEYSFIYRPFASSLGRQFFCHAYNKTTDSFIPINYMDAAAEQLAANGVSAVTNVGRYLYIAANGVQSTYSQVNRWGNADNQRWYVGWVRQGAYSRTFVIRMTRTDGSIVTASYKTMPSAYQGTLNTSDIPFYLPDGVTPDPEYQKKLNDRTNAYNSAVTKHIGEAAADITPENIAQKLAEALVAQGVPASRIGGSTVIDAPGFTDISVEDGGDGSLMVGVGNEVSTVDRLSSWHMVGKVVRVRPRGAQSKEAYYMQAHAKNNAGTGWQEVIWREAAGVSMQPQYMWVFGVLSGGQLYLAGNPALLPGGPHPTLKANEVGDGASCPIPNFYGRQITMLTVFQDRLIVGSEGVVTCSRPGDYLNFWRETVLEVRDGDPVEMYAYGAEGDVLRASALFDRDLVVFGDQKQYAISGRAALTPKAPNIAVMSSHEDSTQANPVASGNLVFYGKQRKGRTSMHQIQVGVLTESPDSIEISQQLDTYLKGRPAQIVALTAPNTVVFRTEELGGTLYIYNYVDTPGGGERQWDAWCTWRYDDGLGTIAAVAPHKGELLVFSTRIVNGVAHFVCDRQSLSTELSPTPYLDSQVLDTQVPAGWHVAYHAANPQAMSCALDNNNYAYLFGDAWINKARLLAQVENGANHLWVGVYSDALVQPTNPFVRDSNGKAIVGGRLTLTTVAVSMDQSAGMQFSVSTRNGMTTREVNAERTLGDDGNIIGKQPLYTGDVLCSVGRETRECSYSITSTTWLPATITALSWTGQYFNRVRRIG